MQSLAEHLTCCQGILTNLVWKLDLVLRGFGNENLLDTYDTERLPVIRSVIGLTDFMTKAMATPNKFAQALRDAFIPMVSSLAPFQNAFVQRLSELGINYRGSPIVEGPGSRFFDGSLCGGSGICSRFLLIVGDDPGKAGQPSSLKEAAKQMCASLADVVELRGSLNPGVTLVRPDGYIAFASHVQADPDVLAFARSVLERHTSPAAVKRNAG